MTKKGLIITILVLAVIYFVLLPHFWPKPKIVLFVSNTDNSRGIREATVTVHTWHSNVALFAASGIFNVDKSKNDGSSVVAVNFLSERDKKIRDSFHAFGIGRWTWPRSYNFKLELPIDELREKTDSDYVAGRIYVKLRYPLIQKGFTKTSEVTLVKKVTIMLSE
jgi:hypothetical protein